MMTASSAFLEPQHSLSTSPGIATGTVTLARKRLSSSALAIKISVDASKTIIMTQYYKRNSSTDFKIAAGGPADRVRYPEFGKAQHPGDRREILDCLSYIMVYI